MEVHAHTHTARKKWTHYFWEFFMLFLAVTLGFFVENKREHYIEHKRADAFAESMHNDLVDDTAFIGPLLKRYEMAAACVDTFINLMAGNDDPKKIPGGKLYWYGLWGGFLNPFASNDATFQQMKNSGSLRYFQNRELTVNIGRYDQLVRKVMMLIDQDIPVYIETRKARSKIFDFRYNKTANDITRSMYDAWAYDKPFDQSRIDSFTTINFPLLTYDRTVLNEYVELCRSRILAALVSNIKLLLLASTELIMELKKEYHLK